MTQTSDVFTPLSGILVQRDMQFVGFDTVSEALEDQGFDFDPEEIAMLISNQGDMCELNLSSALLWDAMDGKRTLSDLIDVLGRHFDIDRKTAEADALELFDRLLELGVVTRTEGTRSDG